MDQFDKPLNLKRRELLAAAAAAVVVSGALPATATIAGPATRVPKPLPSPPKNFSDVQSLLSNNRWITAKKQLLQSPGVFPWLETFSEDLSVDAAVY